MTRKKIELKIFKLKLSITENNYLLFLSSIVGLAVGFLVIIFRVLLHEAYQVFFIGGNELFGLPRYISTPLLPAIGGLIVGIVVYKYFAQEGSQGVPSVMRAVATKKLTLSPRMAVKSYMSIITIGFGGSAGPEGPVVEIGSVIGETIGRWAGISRRRYGVLIGCGSAAGIAAIFNAPLGGVFFALEIILRDFAIKTFSPVVLSAVVASILSKLYFGNNPVFSVKKGAQQLQMASFTEIFFFILLGIICGILSVTFIRLLYKSHDVFKKINIKNYMKPVIGGMLVGMMGYFLPAVLGEGYYGMNEILNGRAAIQMLLLWGIFKLIATSLTLGSGGAGGVFAPSLFIGAAAGGLTGSLLLNYAPQFVSFDAPILYALAGMAGVIAGTLNAPLTAILMIFEITGGNYEVFFPLMITVAVSSLVTKTFQRGSIYTHGLLKQGFDVEQASIPNPLQNVSVIKVMRAPKILIDENQSLPEILSRASLSDETFFPVINKENKFIGIISINDLRSVLTMGEMGNLFTAKDIADAYPQTLKPDDTLEEALDILSRNELEAIPVVDPAKPKALLGIIKRHDIFSIYKDLSEGKNQDLS